MSLPSYPAYKASGVEWLGEVPGHWDVKPLRYLAGIRKGRLPSETFPISTCDTDLPYLSMEFLRGETDTPNFVSDAPNLLCAESGDILVLWDGSNAGEFLRAKHGAVSSTVALIAPKNIDKDFLAFSCKARERQLKEQTVGMGIPHVSGKELLSFAIPCPSPSEQTQIAAFLDRETAKIDELVAEQRRLMELLREKRQAVISHAVTKGLNPNVPMKDSGIEWLGDVPAHWEIKPLKHVGTIVSGYAFSSSDFTSSGIRVLKIANIQTFKIDWSDDSYLPNEFFFKHPKFVVKNDDVVFALTRPIISTGLKAAVADIGNDQVLLNQRNALFRPFEGFSKLFIYQVLFSNSFLVAFENKIDFTGQQPNISPIDIGDIRISVPPLSEQIIIAGYLESLASDYETLTAEANRAIELLQERRSALISAAVTGKIDVRATKI